MQRASRLDSGVLQTWNYAEVKESVLNCSANPGFQHLAVSLNVQNLVNKGCHSGSLFLSGASYIRMEVSDLLWYL